MTTVYLALLGIGLFGKFDCSKNRAAGIALAL
jgi:hypothetical protein